MKVYSKELIKKGKQAVAELGQLRSSWYWTLPRVSIDLSALDLVFILFRILGSLHFKQFCRFFLMIWFSPQGLTLI